MKQVCAAAHLSYAYFTILTDYAPFRVPFITTSVGRPFSQAQFCRGQGSSSLELSLSSQVYRGTIVSDSYTLDWI